VHADALFGSPDIIAIVAGKNIKLMDEVMTPWTLARTISRHVITD